MRLRNIIISILFFGFLFCFYSCNNSPGKNTDLEPLKIGAILPITGKYADIGKGMQAGIEIAMLESDFLSEEFEIIYGDAKSEAKDAVTAYRKLVNIDKVDAIISGSSALSLALKPLTIQDGILFFSVASHPEITQGDQLNIFRVCNTSIQEGQVIAQYINGSESIQNAWILFLNSEFGLSFENQIEKLISDKYRGSSAYDEKPETFKQIAEKTIREYPDAVVLIGFTPSMGLLLRNLREFGYKGEIMCNIGFFSQNVMDAAGDAALGVKYVEYDFPYKSIYHSRLDSIARKNYKTNYTSMSYLSYISIEILGEYMKERSAISLSEFSEYIKKRDSIIIKGMKLSVKKNGDILPSLYLKEFASN